MTSIKDIVSELLNHCLITMFGNKKLYKKHEINKAKNIILNITENSIKSCAIYDFESKKESLMPPENFITYLDKFKQEVESR